MLVAVVGGTGALGAGLALRLAANNEVIVGSRVVTKAVSKASQLSERLGKSILSDTNVNAAWRCDAAILAVPEAVDSGFIEELTIPLAGKLVISPIVPVSRRQGRFVHALAGGSAAERIARILPTSRVAAALHGLPATSLADLEKHVDFDVLVCADAKEVYDEAARVISSIEGVRPLYAGPLSASREVESLTPVILNVAKLNGLRNLSIRFVS